MKPKTSAIPYRLLIFDDGSILRNKTFTDGGCLLIVLDGLVGWANIGGQSLHTESMHNSNSACQTQKPSVRAAAAAIERSGIVQCPYGT